MQSESLILPLVLNAHDQTPIIEQACTTASSTELISWGLYEGDIGSVVEAGAAMGCEDGSVYIFFVNATTSPNSVSPTLSPGNHTAPSSSFLGPYVSRETSPSPPASIKFPTHPGNASFSNHVPHPLYQPTRSRITSSVSKASAEAPKTYVDFDNEKDKLEGMLKGGVNVREKSTADGLRASNATGLGMRIEVDSGSGSQRKSLQLPRTETTPRESLSYPPSPSSLSSLSSPNLLQSAPPGQTIHVGVAPPLTLMFHVHPPGYGPNHRVVSLHHLSFGILVALQESGYDSCSD